MSAKADKKHVSHAGSLIGAGTVVSGGIFFSGGLRIDGEEIPEESGEFIGRIRVKAIPA